MITALGIDVLMVLAVVLVFANVGRVLGPRPPHAPDAELPYETGEPPFQQASTSMSVLYWRFAVLFVVFDVDLAFLLPWAFNRQALRGPALLGVTVFTALVFMMLAYFWRKGALEVEP